MIFTHEMAVVLTEGEVRALRGAIDDLVKESTSKTLKAQRLMELEIWEVYVQFDRYVDRKNRGE